MSHGEEKTQVRTVLGIVGIVALLIAGIAVVAVVVFGTRFRIEEDGIYFYE